MDGINASAPRGFVGVETVKTPRPAVSVDAAVQHQPVVSVPQSTPPPDRAEQVRLEQALARIKEQADKALAQAGGKSRLVIRKDEASNRFIYEFVDKESGEVIQRFPADSLLKAHGAAGGVAGILVDEPA